MTQKIFLVSKADRRIRFEVLDYDPETKEGRLRGLDGATFTRDISKGTCEQLGYTKEVVDDEPRVSRKPRDEED